MPQIQISGTAGVREGSTGGVDLTFLNVSILSATVRSYEVDASYEAMDRPFGYSGGITSVSAIISPARDYTINVGSIFAHDDLEIGNNWITIEFSAPGHQFANGASTYRYSFRIIENDQAGTDGRDTLIGDSGRNLLVGLEGKDYLEGGDGDDRLEGGSGNDALYGSDGHDHLLGGSGNDIIDGGTGRDDMTGGTGNDTYFVDRSREDFGSMESDFVYERPDEGIDTVKTTTNYTLGENVENLVLSDFDSINGTGNDADNRITGNAGDNILQGMGGDDQLRGGEGADWLLGGEGNDRYYVGVGDRVTERGAQGMDWVFSSISWALGSNLERLSLVGADWVNAVGNTKDNVISGNQGRNVITGGLGADTMTGKAGSDTFVWRSTDESIVADADKITDLNDNSDKIDFRQLDGDVNTAGIQGFDIVDGFSGQAGELVLAYDAGTNITALTVDVNGDGRADMTIHLMGEHESFDRFLFGGG